MGTWPKPWSIAATPSAKRLNVARVVLAYLPGPKARLAAAFAASGSVSVSGFGFDSVAVAVAVAAFGQQIYYVGQYKLLHLPHVNNAINNNYHHKQHK